MQGVEREGRLGREESLWLWKGLTGRKSARFHNWAKQEGKKVKFNSRHTQCCHLSLSPPSWKCPNCSSDSGSVWEKEKCWFGWLLAAITMLCSTDDQFSGFSLRILSCKRRSTHIPTLMAAGSPVMCLAPACCWFLAACVREEHFPRHCRWMGTILWKSASGGELGLALICKVFSDQLLCPKQVNPSHVNISRPSSNLTFSVCVCLAVEALVAT